MSPECLGCFGSGRFGTCGSATDGPASTSPDRACDRCGGTGREPASEVQYVRQMNARIAARNAGAA